jgi:hypothetical protein
MSGGRSNNAIAVVGRKFTGKSTWLADFAEKFYRRTRKRVLIIDPNGSPAFSKYQLLNEKQLSLWCKEYNGIARFYIKDKKRMFELLDENFRGGLLIMDDATKYIKRKPPEYIEDMLVDHRMWDADVICTFHSVMFVPIFFWKMLTHVQIFKTQDTFDSDSTMRKRVPNWQLVKKTWDSVMKSKSEFTNKNVKTLI